MKESLTRDWLNFWSRIESATPLEAILASTSNANSGTLSVYHRDQIRDCFVSFVRNVVPTKSSFVLFCSCFQSAQGLSKAPLP